MDHNGLWRKVGYDRTLRASVRSICEAKVYHRGGAIVRTVGLVFSCMLLASCNQSARTIHPWPQGKYEPPEAPSAPSSECQLSDWSACGTKHLEAHLQMRTRFEFIFGFKSYAEAIAVLQPDGVRIPANTIDLRFMMGRSGEVRSKICNDAETCTLEMNDIDRIECVGATVTLDGRSASNSTGMLGCPSL